MKTVSIVTAIFLSVIALSPARADDADTMNPKDAELQMLRSAVKRQADELEPLQTRVKAQDAIIQKLNDELALLKNAARDADQLRAQLAQTSKELEDIKQVLAARDNQLSEANAKLLASQIASGKAVPAGGNADPVKAEFVASFQKFATQLRPAFETEYALEMKKEDAEARNNPEINAIEAQNGDTIKFSTGGEITNFKSDVITTNSAVNPLVGIVTVACYTGFSADVAGDQHSYRETLVVTMRFTRISGYWELIDATRRTEEITRNGNLGTKDDDQNSNEPRAEVDFSRSPIVDNAVIAAHGLLPKK